MSVIKAYSVGCGDMFHIDHNTDNFTIIDCCIDENNKKEILKEIKTLSSKKGITRFISTHPDDDHFAGLEMLDDEINILNFYCVNNKATKADETESFKHYCKLRDDAVKAFYIKKDCSRRWMNLNNEERGSSGINILWPDLDNKEFKDALKIAEEGGSPNNISAVIKYSVQDGATVLWMGDLEGDFMEKIKDNIALPLVDILFAPHHGRDTGKIPGSMLETMDPRVIIIGEAPSQHLNYYSGFNTITQNSAGDIIFECEEGVVHIFTSNEYEVDFLEDQGRSRSGYYYLGTLKLTARARAKGAA